MYMMDDSGRLVLSSDRLIDMPRIGLDLIIRDGLLGMSSSMLDTDNMRLRQDLTSYGSSNNLDLIDLGLGGGQGRVLSDSMVRMVPAGKTVMMTQMQREAGIPEMRNSFQFLH